MSKGYHQTKYAITNHAVVRFRQRVDPDITAKVETHTEIERKLREALGQTENSQILRNDSSIAYPVYFSWRGRKYGPYYCIAQTQKPTVIVTLLTEEQFQDRRTDTITLEDTIGDK
mgnify:CR=1 FL=1